MSFFGSVDVLFIVHRRPWREPNIVLRIFAGLSRWNRAWMDMEIPLPRLDSLKPFR